MTKAIETLGRTIYEGLIQAERSGDLALADKVALTATMLKASAEIGMPLQASETLFGSMERIIQSGFSGRAELIKVHKELAEMHAASPIREQAFGSGGNKNGYRHFFGRLAVRERKIAALAEAAE
jgi:hypothetical protein